jgi:hypothetical protein
MDYPQPSGRKDFSVVRADEGFLKVPVLVQVDPAGTEEELITFTIRPGGWIRLENYVVPTAVRAVVRPACHGIHIRSGDGPLSGQSHSVLLVLLRAG